MKNFKTGNEFKNDKGLRKKVKTENLTEDFENTK
jgi:hypothetical protein